MGQDLDDDIVFIEMEMRRPIEVILPDTNPITAQIKEGVINTLVTGFFAVSNLADGNSKTAGVMGLVGLALLGHTLNRVEALRNINFLIS